jgi:DNA invertase Pin-like site-specific DNA recombinase
MSDSLYKVALYMRISKDDKTQKESESIETQRKILNDFCIAKGFAICGEYIDDGFSGTDYKNRPAFLRLMDDIDNKKINLVITKDLSRLGRNSAETGYLLDTVFPQKKVRYISVCESIDTNNRDSSYNLITPVFNFTNELYCADISNKIRSALEIKMKN